MIAVAAALAAPGTAWSGDVVVTVVPLEPATSVRMLSAPHVGKRTCEVAADTRVRFIDRANHGTHRYGRIEVLEGACAGRTGYVPWSYLDPEPPRGRRTDTAD